MNGPWLRLLKLVRRSQRNMILTTALGLLQSATFLPIAFLVRRMFNVAVPKHDRAGIVLIGVAIAGLGLLGAAIGVAAQRIGRRTARLVVADLRKDLMRRLYAQPSGWHDRHDPGLLELTVVHHTERISDLLSQLTSQALPALVLAVTLALATLLINPLLTLCVIVTAPVYALVGRVLGGRSRAHYREWLSAHNRFGVATRIAVRTLELARVHGAQAWEIDRRDEKIEDVVAHAHGYDNARALYEGAQNAVTGVGGVVPLIVGGLAVSDGTMTIGGLLAFYSLGVIVLRATGTAVTGIANASISSEALAEVDALTEEDPPVPHGGVVLPRLSGAIAFEDVEFAYDGAPVLRNLSFEVGPGEHVALMGPSGAGKTTIVSLLLGLYEPVSGVVRVDGVALAGVDIAALRRQIGVIMQDTVVFPGTIAENIAYGRDADPSRIALAAEQAGLDGFVAELRDGYAHQVGEEGGLLSGGQRQRIGIARALMGDPAMLLLDEPTLNLDSRSIHRLLTTLSGLECTIVTVTHDPDVAARADRIIHVRNGAVWRDGMRLPDLAAS